MTALRAWAASRALVLVAGLVMSLVFGLPERGVDAAVPDALALLGGWDTTWYLDIARHGYEHDLGQVGLVFTNLAFFPLVPGIMAAFLTVGINPFVGALVVSNAAFLGALLALEALTRARMGEAAARRAAWTMALLPPAAYCSLAYTEGLAIACAAGAALLATRGRWALAGVVAGAGALARPTGALAALLVGLLALQDASPGRLRRAALAVLPTVAAFAGFLAWMAVARGSWQLPFEAQRAWDRGQLGIGLVTAAPEELAAGWELVSSWHLTAAWHATARDVAFLALWGWLLARLWRAEGGLRSPWVAYSAAALAVPLSSGTVTSMARFGLMAFPLVWPLADWAAASPRRTRWAVAAAVALTLLLVAQLTQRSP
ncbi:hypothetical protein [Miltoncostaea marina]|uniref:hypothetical protein n=1 Tax=Miltoncostaea marina TaxID=2843215 RepID=UPI001C3E5E2F|nr:hypothetical protein [Miltoncostaea marina]